MDPPFHNRLAYNHVHRRSASPFIWSASGGAAAERTAWNLEKETYNFDVVCINPPLVVGPNLAAVSTPDELNESSGANPSRGPGLLCAHAAFSLLSSHLSGTPNRHTSAGVFVCGGVLSWSVRRSALCQHTSPKTRGWKGGLTGEF